jgi:hypothetical protein
MQKALIWQVKLSTVFIVVMIVMALGMGVSMAEAITRGYNSDDDAIRPGMVVALSSSVTSENPKVERASFEFVDRVIGIATTADDSLVTITSGSKSVYVETSGEVDAYVVDLEGKVKQGDLLSLSPIRGVLAKATAYSPVIAIAVEDFVEHEAETHTIQDNPGTRNVLVDKLKVSLDRKALTSQATIEQTSALSKLGRSVVGKDVAEVRVIVALILFFIVMIAEGGIIYGAVSSAISSLGRNPLARGIIRHELIRVILLALVVLGLGVLAIYGILWV